MAIDIKATLRARGLKQKHLAVMVGVSEPTVSVWMRALSAGQHQRVPAEKATALAVALGLRPGVIRPDLWPLDVAASVEAA